MAAKRTIAVVTGSRAEFGLLEPVMRAIESRRGLRLRVIVAGLHLVTGTWRDVRDAGLAIDAKARMQVSGSGGRGADVQAVARGVGGFGSAFDKLKPDIVVVLGDRIEVLAAAAAAHVGGRHVAHIHGGDRAEGVADESIRHATSKLAHLHLAATAQSRRRLIRMGEQPQHVFNVGSPAVDGLSRVKRDGHDARDADVAGDSRGTHDLLVLQHPIGASRAQEKRWMAQTLAAVRRTGRPFHVFAPNHDPGHEGIAAAIRTCRPIRHLPRRQFLSRLAAAGAIVGNSSAGLIEAAALKVPCVNVGPRQNGRQKPANVVDCDYGQAHVAAAIRKALRLDLRRMRHPYGDGRAGARIAELLASIDLSTVPLRKRNRY